MEKLRVTFKKCEGLRYVGHLDILRTFTRALSRCGFPLKYSEGFNPHPSLVFNLPTGVGVTSDCEIVDIGFTAPPDTEKFLKDFKACVLPGTIEPISAETTDAPMPEIQKASYSVKIVNDGKISAADFAAAAENPEIIVEKKTKKGMKEVNIKEYIYELSAENISESEISVKMTIAAGNTFNLKPSLVISGIARFVKDFRPLCVLPHREKYFFVTKT